MRNPHKQRLLFALSFVTCLIFTGLFSSAFAQSNDSMKLVWSVVPLSYQKYPQRIEFYYKGKKVLDIKDAIFTIESYGYNGKLYTPKPKGEYLIIHSYSGGAHCCSKVRIFQTDGAFKELVSLDIPGVDAFWEDVNNDGVMELITSDYTFDYWHTYHAASAMPRVILRFDGTALKAAGDLMKTPSPSVENLMNAAHKIQSDQGLWEQNKPGSAHNFPGIITSNVLDLLYGGHPELALRFIEEAWSPQNPQKDTFIHELNKQLDKSPFWRELKTQGFKGL